MKGIGTFVAVLLVSLGVAGYLVSRPPARELDATGRAWVRSFESWRSATERRIDRALVEMDFESEARNARLVEPLRRCSHLLARLGEPPQLLEPVREAAFDACGRAEHAIDVNDRFGAASLATVKLNLSEAGDRLVLSRRVLKVQLGEAS